MLVSQPSVRLLPLQSANPGSHAPLQTPALQEGVTWLDEQAEGQLPQWLGSELRSVSQPSVSLSPLQSANPGSQVPLQTPALQERVTWLAEQDVAQAPQLLGSELRSVSQPSVRLSPLQSAKPGAQVPLQTPALQDGVTWLAEQTVAQPPQLLGSELTLTSQPSVRLSPLQSAKPGTQAPLKTPALREGVEWGVRPDWSHTPQMGGSGSV